MTDYERGYEQGKADATKKMHPEIRKFFEDYFDKCFKEYAKYNPPIRQWIGLTDEEIKEIIGPWGDTPIKGYTRKLFDQIEAKLKEKNT